VFTAEQLAAMPGDVGELKSKIDRAVTDSQLIESAATNIRTLSIALSPDTRECSSPRWARTKRMPQIDIWHHCELRCDQPNFGSAESHESE